MDGSQDPNNAGYGQQGWGSQPSYAGQYQPSANYNYQPQIAMPQSSDMMAIDSGYQQRSTMQIAQSQMMQGLGTALQGTMMAGSAIAMQSQRMMQGFQNKFESASTRYGDVSIGNGSYALETSLFREVASKATGDNTFMRRLLVGARPEFLGEGHYQNIMNASWDARWDTGTKEQTGIGLLGAGLSMSGVGLVPGLAIMAGQQVANFAISGQESVATDRARRKGRLESLTTRYGTGNAFMTQDAGGEFEAWIDEKSYTSFGARATAATFGKDSFIAKAARADWTREDARGMMKDLGLYDGTKMDVESMRKATEAGFEEIKKFAEMTHITRAKSAEAMKILKDLMPGASVNDPGFKMMFDKIGSQSRMTGLTPEALLENSGFASQLASRYGMSATGTMSSMNSLMSSLTMMQSQGRTPLLDGVNVQQATADIHQWTASNMRTNPFMIAAQFGMNGKDAGEKGAPNFLQAIGNFTNSAKSAGGTAGLIGGMLDLQYDDIDPKSATMRNAVRLAMDQAKKSVSGLDDQHAFKYAMSIMGIGPGSMYKAFKADFTNHGSAYLSTAGLISQLQNGELATKELQEEGKLDPASAARHAKMLGDSYSGQIQTISQYSDSLQKMAHTSPVNIDQLTRREAGYAALGGLEEIEKSILNQKAQYKFLETKIEQKDYLNYYNEYHKPGGISMTDTADARVRLVAKYGDRAVGSLSMSEQERHAALMPTYTQDELKEFGSFAAGKNIDEVKGYVSKKYSGDDVIYKTRSLLAATGLTGNYVSGITRGNLSGAESAEQQVDKASDILDRKMFADVLQDRGHGNHHIGLSSGNAIAMLKPGNKFAENVRRLIENGNAIGDDVEAMKGEYLSSLPESEKNKMLASPTELSRTFNSALHDVSITKNGKTYSAASAIQSKIQKIAEQAGPRTKYLNTADNLLISTGKFVAGSKDSQLDSSVSEFIAGLAPEKQASLKARIAKVMEGSHSLDETRSLLKGVIDDQENKGLLIGNDTNIVAGLRNYAHLHPESYNTRVIASYLTNLAEPSTLKLQGQSSNNLYSMADQIKEINEDRKKHHKGPLTSDGYIKIVSELSDLQKAGRNELVAIHGLATPVTREKKVAQDHLKELEADLVKNKDALDKILLRPLTISSGHFDPDELMAAEHRSKGLETILQQAEANAQNDSNSDDDDSTQTIKSLNKLLQSINDKLSGTPKPKAGKLPGERIV